MSLDTVLQIGKVLRNSENRLKYFKYVESCPKDDRTGEWPICITIPVNSDYTFDWKGMKITPENERENLYYLKYTTSDNDSSPKKYLFGDILYTRKSEVDKTGKIRKIKDFGNFTFEKGKKNAFINGLKTYEDILDDFYSSLIYPILSDDIKNRKTILKAIISAHKSKNKIDIPKKITEYSAAIESSMQILKKREKEYGLIQFHIAFEKDIEKFNQLLLMAPAFEYIIMNENEKLETVLSNPELLKEKYLKVIEKKNTTILKRLLLKNETFDLLSAETRNKLLQFADFTVFVHFEFNKGGNKISWHQYEEIFKRITNKLNTEITKATENGIVPIKSIYRTLCSGNNKNDIQFPAFNLDKSYKSFSFENYDQFEDFLYTGSILNRPFRRLRYTNIVMYVYPITLRGEQFSTEDYDTFFFNKKDETRLVSDPVFSIFQNEGIAKAVRFDFVFSDNSGNTTNDLIEISGIEKSTLRNIQKRIENISMKINQEKISSLNSKNEYNNLQIEISLRNILGNAYINKNGKMDYKTSAKYEAHLLKVLPLIYTSNYYRDDLLLSAFIQVAEYIVRNIEKKSIWFNYADLKYHLKFLYKIQNTKNDMFMEITSSESYQIGFMLGGLAKNLSQEINSFEKNYVGNLTRRIGTMSDFIKLKNEIEQKLIMHDKTKYTFQKSYDLAQKIKEFKSRYDKEECAFGFMENYFKPIPKATMKTTENTENQ
ncbi:MAG: hypothetical protein PHW82_05465 [Bacteroidales bacterium]|nr:hypothetical protein [Bacteroidales bacterium]